MKSQYSLQLYVSQRSSILYFQQNGSRPDTSTPNICVYVKLNLPPELGGTQTNDFPLEYNLTTDRSRPPSVQVRSGTVRFKLHGSPPISLFPYPTANDRTSDVHDTETGYVLLEHGRGYPHPLQIPCN